MAPLVGLSRKVNNYLITSITVLSPTWQVRPLNSLYLNLVKVSTGGPFRCFISHNPGRMQSHAIAYRMSCSLTNGITIDSQSRLFQFHYVCLSLLNM